MTDRQINKNGQEALFHTDLPSAQGRKNHAKLTLMHCHKCNNLYMGQGCDWHIRRCPSCQYGVLANTMDRGPGLPHDDGVEGGLSSPDRRRPFDGDCIDDVDAVGPGPIIEEIVDGPGGIFDVLNKGKS